VFGWSVRGQHVVLARVMPGGRFSSHSMALLARGVAKTEMLAT
jgi:hypothetical protein